MRSRRNFLFVFILLLPIAGATILGNRASTEASTHATAPVNVLFKVTSCRLFSAHHHGLITMSNAQAIKYENEAAGGSHAPFNVSTFSLDAPLVYDGSVGDLSTGYSIAGNSGSGGGALHVLYDLGSSPPSVSGFELEASAEPALNVQYSSNGTAWTQIYNNAGPPLGSKVTVSTTTARYWQFIIINAYSGASIQGTDARLYDGSGVLIGGPTSSPPSFLLKPIIANANRHPQPASSRVAIVAPPTLPPIPPGALPQYVGLTLSQSAALLPAPAKQLFLPGPLLVDGYYDPQADQWDTSTGYTQGATGPSQQCVIYALYDLARPVQLGGLSLGYPSSYGQAYTAWYSTDYATWTTLANSGYPVIPHISPLPPGPNGALISQAFTARYVLIAVRTPGGNCKLTDFHLLNPDGSVYTAYAALADAATGSDVAYASILNTTPFNDADSATGTDAMSATVGRPTVIYGSSRTFAGLGTETQYAVPSTQTWQVYYMIGGTSAVLVGNNTTVWPPSSAWGVMWDGSNFTVTAPLSGDPSIGTANYYMVLYQSAAGVYQYAYFDTESPTSIVKALADSATGSEDLSHTGALALLTDSATGSDASTVIATISVSDSATGAEAAIGPSGGITTTDSASGTDTASVTYIQSLTDGAVSADVMGYDDGAGGGTYSPQVQDTAAGTDVATVSAVAALTDGAAGSDVFAFASAPTIAFTDSATGTDAASIPGASTGRLQIFFD